MCHAAATHPGNVPKLLPALGPVAVFGTPIGTGCPRLKADLQASLAHYNQLASEYDRSTRLINQIRLRAIAALNLAPGDTVVDAGCGTGFCLGPLRDAVGEHGTVIGFEPAEAMLAIAESRVQQAQWKNVKLLCADGLGATLPETPNAWLFSYTHDLIQSREALNQLFSQSADSAKVAATSTKLYAPWFWPGNAWLKWRHRGYITDFSGFDAPWANLLTYLSDANVRTGPLTQHYVATGRLNKSLIANRSQVA